MAPKNSDYSSDESQPSEMEIDIPCTRPGPTVNTSNIVSSPPSSDNSSVSPSGSSVSSSAASYCDNHNPLSNGKDKRKHETFPLTQKSSGKVTESVSSLSVPSSPEPTLSPCGKEPSAKESPVAYLYETRNHNTNRFSYPDVPRTAPCIVLSPSNSSNPVIFSHHNPVSYSPSSLIMSVPPMPFQMFHHHQSTLMSKINPLCFKTVDVGMQRFREFCADHNFNAVGSGFKPNKFNDDNYETGSEEKGDFSHVIRNSRDKKTTKDSEKQEERESTNDKSLRSQSSSGGVKRLSFGIDRILAEGKDKGIDKETSEHESQGLDEEQRSNKDPVSKRSLVSPPVISTRQPILYQNTNSQNHHHHHHPLNHPPSSDHSHRLHSLSSASQSPLNLTNRCTDCYLLGRFCRNNGTSTNLHYPSLVSSSSGVNGGGGGGLGGSNNGVPASFSPWMTNASIYENSPLLSPSAYHTQSTLTSAYNMGSASYSTMTSLVSCNNNGPGGRRKRSWSRAVFSSLQRKGLEKRFQIQKYITKPDRRQLAATLGLTDAQVKVWFQNRRMKWRHSKEGKVTSGVGDEGISVSTTVISSPSNSSADDGQRTQRTHPVGASSSSSSTIDLKA